MTIQSGQTHNPFGALKLLDYRLLLAVFLTLLAPATYATARIYFIADIPSEWGFNIASQISWLNIIYEILQEAIVLPLFYILGSAAGDRKLFTNRFVFGLKIILPVYVALSVLVWIFVPQLVVALDQQAELVGKTIHYIRLETIVLPLRTFIDMAFVAFVVLNLKRAIYGLLAAQVVVRFGFDGMFISQQLLGMGVTGVAYSSICIAVTLSVISAALLLRTADFGDYGKPFAKGWTREWLSVCCYSGMESAVRNTAFIAMILRLVNEVQQSGTFWVTNGFVWNWLLLPVLAIGNVIKADVAINGGAIGKRFTGYLWLVTLCVFLWVASIPGWGAFISSVMGIDNFGAISSLALFMLGFYMVFAFKNTIDSYLYGMGKLGWLLFQSILVNSVYYGIAFILYITGIFTPTLHSIAALFGWGMVFGCLVTFCIFRYLGYPVKRGGDYQNQRRDGEDAGKGVAFGAIADDFTGATDLANTLVGEGVRTALVIGAPDKATETGDADAVVVALKSRTCPAEAAVSQSLATLDWLRAQGARQTVFKYCSTFDSTPNGNIGPVADALSEALASEIAVVCPAFPANGRTVRGGDLFVNGVPLAESPMRDHPLTPMRDSNLPRLMSAQSRLKTGLVPLPDVQAGPGAIRSRLEELATEGCRYAVADALTDEDLRSIGAALAGHPLVTGGSGIAMGLPENLRKAGVLGKAGPPALPTAQGRALIVAGSCSTATRAQIARAQTMWPWRRINVDRLAEGRDEVGEVASWVLATPGDRPVLIFGSADPAEVAANQERFGAQRAGEMVEGALAGIAAKLVGEGFNRLVVAGGETSGAVVSALGISVLRIGPEIAPGVPWTESRAPHLALALKSGNFGSETFFEDALRMLP